VHPNQKGGCPDTLDTPWIRPCSTTSLVHCISYWYYQTVQVIFQAYSYIRVKLLVA